ncbi:MAG: hypothetical protein VYE76_00955, partial [Pseudomonadota bacterium]|nr:hypothetical protein [Pseudomonadota bacterium]
MSNTGQQSNSGWYFAETGAPTVLEQTSLETPQVAPGGLLVRVIASGFNPIDTKIRAGLAPIASDNRVVGCDLAGEVI